MRKGRLIGKGMTADVYEWGQNKVLKLYSKWFKEEWIQKEASITAAVHEAGVPSPAVFDIIRVNSRIGIVYERIPGKSMLYYVALEPWNFFYNIKKLAQLQYSIHEYSVDTLPSLKEVFKYKIENSSKLSNNMKLLILNYMDSLPDGNNVCHGDFHFNNIIVSGKNLIPIDWSGACRGDPSGDVARTFLMINSPAAPFVIPEFIIAMSAHPKRFVGQTYVNEYKRLSSIKTEDIEKWILPAAAAKLRNGIPGEEKWLMDIIKTRLNKLEHT